MKKKQSFFHLIFHHTWNRSLIVQFLQTVKLWVIILISMDIYMNQWMSMNGTHNENTFKPNDDEQKKPIVLTIRDFYINEV
jgi:hypothetical protein